MSATDQIAFKVSNDCIKEKSTFPVVAYFRDRATAAAVTPTTIHYRADCLETGAQLKDWTSVSPDTSVSITLTPTENAIQSSSNRRERKQLTVAADKDLSTQFIETFIYEVKNVYGIP